MAMMMRRRYDIQDKRDKKQERVRSQGNVFLIHPGAMRADDGPSSSSQLRISFFLFFSLSLFCK